MYSYICVCASVCVGVLCAARYMLDFCAYVYHYVIERLCSWTLHDVSQFVLIQ